jgi:predicted kinase
MSSKLQNQNPKILPFALSSLLAAIYQYKPYTIKTIYTCDMLSLNRNKIQPREKGEWIGQQRVREEGE